MAKLIDGITTAMRYLGAHSQVIAGNIANADTPGFKARTLRAPDFGALVEGRGGAPRRPTVEVTSRMAELGAGRQIAQAGVPDRSVRETKPDGNNVTLEQQLLALGEVQADYATLTSIYRKQMGLVRTALGGRSG